MRKQPKTSQSRRGKVFKETHNIRLFSDDSETVCAISKFFCNIIHKNTIRGHCAIGYCMEQGCPFFRNEEDQMLLIQHYENKGTSPTTTAYSIVMDKRGNKKIKIAAWTKERICGPSAKEAAEE